MHRHGWERKRRMRSTMRGRGVSRARFVSAQRLRRWTAQIPASPPTVLQKMPASDSRLACHRVGTRPPTVDPTNIPRYIDFLLTYASWRRPRDAIGGARGFASDSSSCGASLGAPWLSTVAAASLNTMTASRCRARMRCARRPLGWICFAESAELTPIAVELVAPGGRKTPGNPLSRHPACATTQ